MAKKYAFKYYELEESEIQEIIIRAKNGSSLDQLKLLDVFDNFLKKYITCLFINKYSLSDYDIRRFVALYVKDNLVRRYLVRNKLNPSGVKHVNEIMRGINYMVRRYADPEDVEQTVNLAFLECVKVYQRRESIPFSAYLYSYFFYVLKKKVDAFLIDQSGRKTFPLIDNEEFNEDGENVQGFAPPPVPSAEDLILTEEIDEAWVCGDTAMGPFAILTMQERQLLKWRYVDGERSSEIAARITEHPNTCREHFTKIRAKITKYLEEELGELAK